jgi:hypothetical protein
MSQMIEKSMARNFKLSHFQQILGVCPDFFIHKWEQRKGNMELLIEIPARVVEMSKNEPFEDDQGTTNENPYFQCLSDKLLIIRREQFSEELVSMCYNYFQDKENID